MGTSESKCRAIEAELREAGINFLPAPRDAIRLSIERPPAFILSPPAPFRSIEGVSWIEVGADGSFPDWVSALCGVKGHTRDSSHTIPADAFFESRLRYLTSGDPSGKGVVVVKRSKTLDPDVGETAPVPVSSSMGNREITIFCDAVVNSAPEFLHQAEKLEKRVQAAVQKRFPDAIFQTQEDLEAKGLGPTPDLLFAAPVTLCGHPFVWLDAKSVSQAEVFRRRRATKLAAQFRKYVDAYGPGAFVTRDNSVTRDRGSDLMASQVLIGGEQVWLISIQALESDGSNCRPG